MTTKYANTDLVAVSFIKSLLNQTGGVGTELPGRTQGQPESWASTGFVQVTSGVGGSSDIYTPQKSPVVGVKCWAVAPGNRRVPWQMANNLAETIRNACYGAYRNPVAVALPTGYPSVLVQAAYLLTEPRRLPGDDSNYACYQFNLQLHWKATEAAL